MKCVGDKAFYRMVSKIALPIIIQNGFYYMVNFVDNIMAVIVFVTAPYYPRIYNTTEEVRLLASRFISILAVFMPVSAYIHAAFFTIRAGGNTMITFLFDSSNLWLVSIPLAFCLTRYTGMGIVVIYFICQMADAIKCSVGYILVKKGVWLKNIVQTQLQ